MKRKDWIASILGGVILGVLIVALQASGYLSQAQNVQAASDTEKILKLKLCKATRNGHRFKVKHS